MITRQNRKLKLNDCKIWLLFPFPLWNGQYFTSLLLQLPWPHSLSPYVASPSTTQHHTVMLRVLHWAVTKAKSSMPSTLNIHRTSRMVPIKKKTPQSTCYSLINVDSSRIFREKNANTKLYTEKQATIITARKPRGRTNYFTRSFAYYYF